MGAWIETSISIADIIIGKSHPVWVRGLKPQSTLRGYEREQVAPCMGAWIETRVAPNTPIRAWSHPVWVRGLKRL